MEKRLICEACNPNLNENEPPNLCESCNLVYESNYSPNSKIIGSEQLNLTGKSNYYHLNNEIMLNEDDSSILKGKNLLLVGTGYISKFNIVKMMRNQLNRVICVSPTKTWAYPFVDHWILAEDKNVQQKEETLRRVLEFVEKEQVKLDGIMNYYDECCMMTFYLADKLNLTNIPLEIGNQLKNKHEFRRRCSELKIPCPNNFIIKSNQREAFLRNLDTNDPTRIASAEAQPFCSFPLIVKNPFGFVKSFVKKCANVDEFVNTVKESLNSNIDLLVEEFYEGHEIDCDLLIQDNQVKFLSITDNFPPIEPYFYEQGGTVPSLVLSKQEQDAIRGLISKWASQLNIQNACIHFEARCRPESIFKKANFDINGNLIDESYFLMPIEVNLRVGGAEVWSMIKAVYGVDLIKENLKIAFKIPLDEVELKQKERNPRCKCISKDFDSTRILNINSIKLQVDELIRNPNIVEMVVFNSVGDNLIMNAKYAWLTIKNDDLESSMDEMQRHLDGILKSLRFELD
jgi:carbamoylphosphate synthase large subunit